MAQMAHLYETCKAKILHFTTILHTFTFFIVGYVESYMESQNLKNEQKRTAAKKKLFLTIFSMTLGSVTRTCKHARIHRDTYYEWCKKDQQFAKAVRTEGEKSIGYFVNEAVKEMRPF